MALNPEERYYIKLKAAHLYYNEDLTQQQIAQRLHVSRPTLNKLLKEARNEGMVKIEIYDYRNISQLIELERELCKKLGLKEVKIASSVSEDPELIRDKIARATANYLELLIKSKMKIGIGWGKTIDQTVKYVSPTNNIKDVEFVTLLGGFGSIEYQIHTNSLAETLARQYKNSSVQYISAPIFIQDENLLQALLKEENIRNAMNSMKNLDIALIGVDGELLDTSTTLMTKSIPDEWVEKLKEKNAVGNIASRFFDENGDICIEEFERKVISIPLELLAKTPIVIASAGGPKKVKSLIAAAKKNYYNILITDETTAKAMLEKLS